MSAKLMTPDQTMFESETCGRCSGSGEHSYNQRDGRVCYGCGGSGVRLTKRGSVAQAVYNDALMRRVDQLKVGDVVKFHGATMDARTYTAWAPVVELDLEPKCSGYSIVDGVRKDVWHVKYVTEHSKLGRQGHLAGASSLVRIKGTDEERAAAKVKALEHQANLTKSGKPRKGVAA